MTTSQPTPTTAAPSTFPPYPAPRHPFEPSPSNYLFVVRIAIIDMYGFNDCIPGGVLGLFPTAAAAHVALRKAIEGVAKEWNIRIHTTNYSNGDGTVDIYGHATPEDGFVDDEYFFDGHVRKFAVPGKTWGIELSAERQPGGRLDQATAGEELRTTAVQQDAGAEEQAAADESTLAQQPDTDEEASRKKRQTDDDDIQDSPAETRQRTQDDLDVGSEWPTNVFLLRQPLYQITKQMYYAGFVSTESTTLHRTLEGANAQIRQYFQCMMERIDTPACRKWEPELPMRVEKCLVEQQDGTLKFDTSRIHNSFINASKVWVDRVVVDVAVGESPPDGEEKSEVGRKAPHFTIYRDGRAPVLPVDPALFR